MMWAFEWFCALVAYFMCIQLHLVPEGLAADSAG